MRPTPQNQSWVRDYFKDHLNLAQNGFDAFSGHKKTHDKAKVFCKQCLSHRIQSIQNQESKEVEAGTWQAVRTPDVIEMECTYPPQSQSPLSNTITLV